MVLSLHIRVELRQGEVAPMTSKVEIPQTPVVAQQLVPSPDISTEEKKMLDRLLRLTPSRFSRASGEDTYEFLFACEDRLHNLRFVDIQWVDQTT